MAKTQARKQAEHIHALLVDAVWSATTIEGDAWVRSNEKVGDVLNRLLSDIGEDERKSLDRLVLSRRTTYKTAEDPAEVLYMQIADGFLHALPGETMEQVRNRLLSNAYDDRREALGKIIVARREAYTPKEEKEIEAMAAPVIEEAQ